MHWQYDISLKCFSKVVALIYSFCDKFANFHSIYKNLSANKSQENEDKSDIKIIIIYEKEKGEKEDQNFATTRNRLFVWKKSTLE